MERGGGVKNIPEAKCTSGIGFIHLQGLGLTLLTTTVVFRVWKRTGTALLSCPKKGGGEGLVRIRE